MRNLISVVCLSAVLAGGCEEKPKPAAGTPRTMPNAATASLPSSLILASEPANAKPVDEVKKGVKAGDEVVIRGRVGGSHDPFVAGRAVFTIMSPSVKSCADNPDDACKTPWDYCCETKEDIATHSATIQVVDSTGAPLKAEVKGQSGIKELSELIVVGKVAQAEGKVLVVNATGMFVAKQ